jgi:outer membrane lipoprotein-sorting protein
MTGVTEQLTPLAEPPRPGRRPTRWLVPAGVGAVVIAIVGAVTMIARDPSPSLPDVSPAQLVSQASQARTDALSGSIRITTDVRLPGMGSGGALAKLNGTRTAEIAIDGVERQRVSLTDRGTTYTIVHDGDTLWTYDSGTRTATRSAIPKDVYDGADARDFGVPGSDMYQPQDVARKLLEQFSGHANVTIDGTDKVAGRSVYVLKMTPKDDTVAMFLDRVIVSVDGKTNVPLRAQVYQRNGKSPALDVRFTKVSFDRPAASTFAFQPPAGATVKQADLDRNLETFSGWAERTLGGSLGELQL